MTHTTPRRGLVLAAAALAFLPASGHAQARPALRVFRTLGCSCCSAWAEHLRRAGFEIVLRDAADMAPIRTGASVPADLAGCHTGLLGKLVVEGHVPAAALQRFLARPGGWRGLAVPGMPLGSPSMEIDGMAPETYEVIAFAADGRREAFMRFRGAAPI